MGSLYNGCLLKKLMKDNTHQNRSFKGELRVKVQDMVEF